MKKILPFFILFAFICAVFLFTKTVSAFCPGYAGKSECQSPGCGAGYICFSGCCVKDVQPTTPPTGGGGSCTGDKPLSAKLISPVNGHSFTSAGLPNKTIAFDWSHTANNPGWQDCDNGSETRHFDLRVYKNCSKPEDIVGKSAWTTSKTTATSKNIGGFSLDPMQYCWNVDTTNKDNRSRTSDLWYFTINSSTNPTVGPTNPPGATNTPVLSIPTPTPPNPNCTCQGVECSSSCIFDKYSLADGVNYINPLKCYLTTNVLATVATDANKTSWCQATKRTKGDADGNGVINNADYFYYVAAVNGGKIPVTANPDFNGDGEVGAADRTIIIRSLNP